MMQLLNRLFSTQPRPFSQSQLIEGLETRRMLSASPISFKGGNLQIRGDAEANDVVVAMNAEGTMLTVTMGELSKTVELEKLKKITADLKGGDDSFTFDVSAASFAKRTDLKGGNGDDELHGGDGRNSLKGGKGNDLLVGGEGKDKAQGGQGSDSLQGNGGDDNLIGNGGDDDLDGGAGLDKLSGGGGADMIDGGEGADELDTDDDDVLDGTDDPSEVKDESDDETESEDPVV